MTGLVTALDAAAEKLAAVSGRAVCVAVDGCKVTIWQTWPQEGLGTMSECVHGTTPADARNRAVVVMEDYVAKAVR